MSHRPSREEIERFRRILSDEAGLRFGEERFPALEAVIATRLAATDAASIAVYLAQFAREPTEIAEIARQLTVSESYFLRNRNHFRALEGLLTRLEATGTRRLRVLSAGCSTGEEALSIAMTIQETVRAPDSWSISILGVDINPDTVSSAREGRYSSWSLRATPEEMRRKYFATAGDDYRVVDGLRERVHYEQGNLLDPRSDLWRRGPYDIVFFRNVSIYFTVEAAQTVVRNIARSLVPGGHLFLGHAENLRGISHDYHLRQTHDTFYYERREEIEDASIAPASSRESPVTGEVVALSDDVSWFDTIARASSRIVTLSERNGSRRESPPPSTGEPARRRDPSPPAGPEAPDDLAPAMALMGEERFAEALGFLETVPTGVGREPDALLLGAVALLSTGELEGAAQRCEELLDLDELHAGAHYVMAICCEHDGDYEEAIEHGRAAVYLDREFAMPHLQLGRLARRAGDLGTARRELQRAIDLLPREEPARIVLFGGGFGRDALMQICRGELAACEEDR